MKRFFHSIFFFPVAGLVILSIALTTIYHYILEEEEKTLLTQVFDNAKEDIFLLKSLIEEYSLQKDPLRIQREVVRASTRKYVDRALILCPKGVVHYAGRRYVIGKTLESAFGPTLAAHYRREMADGREIHIHPDSQYRVDASIPLAYLYNPNKQIVENGFLIVHYDLSAPIARKRAELQREFLAIYGIIALAFITLFLFYYRHFIHKYLQLAHLSSTSPADTTPNKKRFFVCIDDLVERQVESVTKMAVMSRVIEYSIDAILVTDAKKRIIAANPAFEDLTGHTMKEALGKRPEEMIKSGVMDEDFYRQMWEKIEKEGRWSGEIIDRRRDGTSFSAWQTIFAIKDPATRAVTNYVAMTRDISDLIEKQKQIRHLAFTDLLTDLPNRASFIESLNEILRVNKRSPRPFALFFIDLDDFKEINDTLGHSAGDRVLQAFARRMEEVLRDTDIPARFGGDEFGVLAPDIQTPEAALELSCRLVDAVQKPFKVGRHTRQVGSSIGIALYPGDGEDAETLLKAADIAMYRAKEKGKNRCTLFEENMQKEAAEKVRLRQELERAIATDELELHLQPKVDTDTDTIRKFEALIRWRHPARGMVGPWQFIPIAEESGLIIPMTEWILKEVDIFLDEFESAGFEYIVIAINISAHHFATQQLIDQIQESIGEHHIRAGRIELEVTESAVMKDIDTAKIQLRELHALGVHVALDDYGTGHSSLSYLKHLPIDTIKIDKTFIDGVPDDEKDCAIVESTIELARRLGMTTVAEGVETAEQARMLRHEGIDMIQGYYYAKPMPFDEAMALLRQESGTIRSDDAR